MEKSSKQSAKDNAIHFIQRFRIILLVLLVVIIAGVIGAIVWEEIQKNKIAGQSVLIEELESAYESLKSAKDDLGKVETKKVFDDLRARIELKNSGTFIQQRSDFYQASIAFDEKDWESAEKYYAKGATDFPSSYLTALCLLNASIATESSGNKAKALEYLNQIINSHSNSSLVPRALFNAGRISEEDQKWDEANKYYQKIIDAFANSNWTKLARDRIIKLKALQQL